MKTNPFFSENKTLVMGVLNVTPDSFSDGGHYVQVEEAVKRAQEMIAADVDIIDIGGQSTRPGYHEISAVEELQRILPVIKEIRQLTTTRISIDTYYPEVAEAALHEGATIINDIKGLDQSGMLEIAQKYPESGLILMHSRPRKPELSVKEDVQQFYQEKAVLCESRGIEASRICFDPGIGFGKSLEENIHILQQPQEFRYQEYPLLYGVSRKRTIAALIDETDPLKRDFGSVAASLFVAQQGVEIVRVHEVKGMKDALAVWEQLK